MNKKNSIKSTRLKTLRETFNLTQDAFAEKIALSTQMISLMERGEKSLNIHTAMEISKKFNVSLDWLYELSDEPKDSASSILIALKEIFNFNWEEKRIEIDGHLATFLEEISKAYKIKADTNMPDEPFNLWIEEIKKRYNENSKEKSKHIIYYHLITSNEYLKEEDDKILNNKSL